MNGGGGKTIQKRSRGERGFHLLLFFSLEGFHVREQKGAFFVPLSSTNDGLMTETIERGEGEEER